MEFKALLFDLDGTLLDTAPDFIYSMNLLLKRHKKPLIRECEIRTSVTDGSEGLLKKGLGIDSTHKHFFDIKNEYLDIYYENIAKKTSLFKGLNEVLSACEKNSIPWGIVTNKPLKYTNHLLEKMLLSNRSAVTICPEHTKKSKPHPEPLILASNLLSLAPRDCLFIGDHIRDIQAGNSAGMRTIAAGWGYVKEDSDIEKWDATFIQPRSETLFDLLFTKAKKSYSNEQ